MIAQLTVGNADDMRQLGQRCAPNLESGMVVFLIGELGVGKTTIVQGMLDGLGYSGRVKSPTYTLVEPYSLSSYDLYHFDLYRLNTPDELESMGVRDFFHARSVCLIEWPDKGEGLLPTPDVEIKIQYHQNQRQVSLPTAWVQDD